MVRAGKVTVKTGDETVHPLNDFEIEKYYENEATFSGVYSRNNLPEKGWGLCNKS